MLQYKIPQNVEVEDKIVGPLTLRQLIICGVGFGIAYVIYISLVKNYYAEVWGPPVAIVSLLTIAIAFVEIRHIPFLKWVFLMIEAAVNPPKRMWDKRESTRLLWATIRAPKKVSKTEQKKIEKKEKKIENLSDISENLDILKMIEISPNAKKNPEKVFSQK